MRLLSKTIIGVDEVGMGCLAGPVVVCAVLLPATMYKKFTIGSLGVRDSKLMTPKQRETCLQKIQKLNLKYQIAFCHPKTIDRMNIYQAARKAMRRAVGKVSSGQCVVLVDGPHIIQNLKLPQRAIVKGDRTVFAIACASVIAKVHRDRMMARYAKRFPEYGFERHKGYGTKLHYTALAAYGPCELHRKSFTIRAL